MKPETIIGREEEPDWFSKSGGTTLRAYVIIRTHTPMMYKTMCHTHFTSEYWNSWEINEHDIRPAIGQPSTGIRINFHLNTTETRVREIVDHLHNFVEAYLQEAEEYKNGNIVQEKETS